MKERGRVRSIGAAALGLAAVLAVQACGGQARLEATPSVSTPDVQPPASAESQASPEQAAFGRIRLSGSGNKVARFRIPSDVAAIAHITAKGSSNFVVWTLAADGSKNDLLVNVIGRYSGTRLFDATVGEHSVAFKVEAHGKWSIVIEPYSKARKWNGSSKVTGQGDDVLLITDPPSGLATVDIRHRGKENFVVTAYSESERDLLVNEIGNYHGESQLPDGTLLLEIEADGSWSVSRTS